ncbi:hypothetical protein G9A89_010049 [Geosiphon pyriformis]|nr:hypothetical protein G9A89_010049 [Geosiphon pyriformis]
MPLNYVDNDAFSGVIVDISMKKLSLVVDNLLNDKAARLSGIPNELWKHCSEEVLVCLLKLLNLCLSMDAVLNLPIILVKTACKIPSKILSDRISLACNKFNVFCGDNFSVLKNTLTQFPIFAIGSVVEDALKKNRELWLVLQDMRKAYDSVGWHHLVIIDFGLLDSYKVHDGLDQEKVFSPLLWRIFYDPLLCEVKRHEQLWEYRIDSKFVAKSDRIETSGKKTSFLAAGVFVDDTIWVKSSQTSMQYILNIASEFFVINDILINNDKMLLINGMPILIARKGESHQYLGIFLLTEDLSKPSLAQAHKNVKFFSNIVLKKAITDKQFCYLVLVVLQPIVSYHVQFSFVTLDVCYKWNIMIRKSLKAKAGLPCDFSSEILYHSSLYRLKSFKQVQSKEKLASLILFSNGYDILRHLFDHRFLDLQVLGWSLLNSLQFSVKLHVSSVNNFLAGMVGAATATEKNVLSVLDSDRFTEVCDSLLEVWSDCIEVYIDRSLRCAGSVGAVGRAAAYFLAANVGIGVKVAKLLSSTLAELQAVVLALECVLSSCSIVLYSDSQSAIDVCISKTSSTTPDFHNQCWIERLQITDALANEAISSFFFLPVNIWKRFLVAEKTAISGNVCYFAWDLHWTKHRVKMEKTNLVGDNSVVSGLSSNIVSMLLAGIVCMLDVIESFAVKFVAGHM